MEIVRTFVRHQGLRLDDRHLDDQPGDDHDHGWFNPAYSHHDKIPPWWGNVSNDLDNHPGDNYDHDDHLDDETDYNYDGDQSDYEHICPTPRLETGS